MASTVIPEPTTLGTELLHEARTLEERHAVITIETRTDLEQSALDRKDISERQRAVADFFAPFKRTANQLHKMLCDRERAILTPLDRLDGALRRAQEDFKQRDDARRRERERREADEQRQRREQQALADAALLERQGQADVAAMVLAEAISTPAPVVVLPVTTEKVSGLSFSRVWKWRPAGGDTPENRSRAQQVIPREFLMLDETKLTRYATGMKDTARIDGIEFYYEDRANRR
jgi:hypothetical protein